MLCIRFRFKKLREAVINMFFLLKNNKIQRPCVLSQPQFICLGRNVRIKKYSRIECYEKFGGGALHPSLKVGDNVIIGYRFSCLVADDISIGENTILASDILITSENHGMNPECDVPYYKQSLITGAVHIGGNCWIGEKVVILPGVTIGDYCIIAASSVITKSIPPYSLAAGNPARIIKKYDFDLHEWVKQT